MASKPAEYYPCCPQESSLAGFWIKPPLCTPLSPPCQLCTPRAFPAWPAFAYLAQKCAFRCLPFASFQQSPAWHSVFYSAAVSFTQENALQSPLLKPLPPLGSHRVCPQPICLRLTNVHCFKMSLKLMPWLPIKLLMEWHQNQNRQKKLFPFDRLTTLYKTHCYKTPFA